MAVGVDVRVHGHGREEDDLCLGERRGRERKGREGGERLRKKGELCFLGSSVFSLFLSLFSSLFLPLSMLTSGGSSG